MLLRLLRWLLLFGALIVICSFVLALLSWFDSAMPPTLTAAFFLLHLHLAPWVPLLLPVLAAIVAGSQRKWRWTLVFIAIEALALVVPLLLPLIFRNYQSPFMAQLETWPYPLLGITFYSLGYATGFIALVAVWLFVRTQDQDHLVEAHQVAA